MASTLPYISREDLDDLERELRDTKDGYSPDIDALQRTILLDLILAFRQGQIVGCAPPNAGVPAAPPEIEQLARAYGQACHEAKSKEAMDAALRELLSAFGAAGADVSSHDAASLYCWNEPGYCAEAVLGAGCRCSTADARSNCAEWVPVVTPGSAPHDQTPPPSHADAESPARGGRQG